MEIKYIIQDLNTERYYNIGRLDSYFVKDVFDASLFASKSDAINQLSKDLKESYVGEDEKSYYTIIKILITK